MLCHYALELPFLLLLLDLLVQVVEVSRLALPRVLLLQLLLLILMRNLRFKRSDSLGVPSVEPIQQNSGLDTSAASARVLSR